MSRCIMCREPAAEPFNLCRRCLDLYADDDQDEPDGCTCWSCKWFGSHG